MNRSSNRSQLSVTEHPSSRVFNASRNQKTNRRTGFLAMLVLSLLALPLGCSKEKGNFVPEDGDVSLEPGWVDLRFYDHQAIQLELDWPYLYVAAGGDGLFRRRADDINDDWVVIGFADTPGSTKYRGVYDAMVLDTGEILAGLNTGIRYAAGLYRSTDDGETWERWDTGIADPGIEYSSTVNRLAAGPASGLIFAGGCAMYRSDNAGETWSLISGNPEQGCINIHALICHPDDSSVLWAGGGLGFGPAVVGTSKDGGQTWQQHIVNTNIFDTYIVSLAVDPTDVNVAYVGMHSGGA